MLSVSARRESGERTKSYAEVVTYQRNLKCRGFTWRRIEYIHEKSKSLPRAGVSVVNESLAKVDKSSKALRVYQKPKATQWY